MKLLSRNEEYLLLAVQRLQGEAYSSSIRDLLKSDTGKVWSFGSIFVSLETLERKRYLTSAMSASEPVQGGRAKRIYSISDSGREALSEALATHRSMWADVQTQLGAAGK